MTILLTLTRFDLTYKAKHNDFCFCLFIACDHTWCGDGTCVPKGTGHTCQCYQGSENLMNNSELACFRQCKAFPLFIK